MLTILISFLVMLNPFALFLYLEPVRKDLCHRDFLNVIFRASFISFVIYLVFILIGDFIFENILLIHFDSFRIFGGIIIFTIAYLFIIKGQKAYLHSKENLDDLASEIALPFMVGAGTISISIIMSHLYPPHMNFLGLVLVMSLNYLIIVTLYEIRRSFKKKILRIAFDKNMEILLRLNGFFLGAIGINMIIEGIINLFM